MSPRLQRSLLADVIERIDAATRAEARLKTAEREGDLELVSIAIDAISYDTVVIGEAVKQFDSSLFERNPHIPWSDIAKMRDRLAHHYYKIDSTVVRETIGQPMQELLEVCEQELTRS